MSWGCLAGAAGLLVAGTSCFWLSDGPFIVGHGTLLRQPLLSHWGNVPAIFSPFFTSFTDGQYRPLSYAMLAAARTFAPLGTTRLWQLWILAFQALNVLLVYGLARSLAGSAWQAFAAAALFALHPLASVMVNHVEHFHCILGLTFFLGAFLAHVWAARTGRWGWRLASVVVFSCGLLTTKAVVTLPVILAVYEWVHRTGWRKALARLVPSAACLLLVTPLWLTQGPPRLFYKYPDMPAGTWLRSLISVVAGSGHYLYGLLAGLNVPMILDEVVKRRGRMTELAFLWPAALYLVVGGAALWLLWQERRGRACRDRVELGIGGRLGFAIVWGLVTFVPFLSTGWNRVEDYVAWPYLYFPLVGLGLVCATLVAAAGRARDALVRAVILGLVATWYACFALQLVRLNLASGSGLSYWRHVLRVNPESARASVALGKCHLQRGEVARALPLLFKASSTLPRSSCLALANYYLDKGELLAAAMHCRAASAPGDGLQNQAAKPLTAELLRRAGVLDSAEALWGEVLLANPFHTAAMLELADILRIKGFVAAARRLISRAIEIDPRDAALQQMLGRLEARPGEAPVIALAPLDELKYLLMDDDSPAVHRKIVAVSERLDTDPVVLLSAAMGLAKYEDHRVSLEKLAKAERLLPSLGLLWATRCFSYVRIGAYPEATAAADKAISLGENDANTCCMVGTALVNQGRAKRGLKCLRRAIEINPSYAAAHTNLALALRSLGLLPAAIAHLRQAVKIDRGNAQAHTDLGATLLAAGQVVEAAACLRTALQLDPKLAGAHVQMASVLLQQGRQADAAKHLQRAERLSPESMRRLPHVPGAVSLQQLRDWRPKPGF